MWQQQLLFKGETDMTEEAWLSIMARISAAQPVDLDQLVFKNTEPCAPTTGAQHQSTDMGNGLPPSTYLWEKDEKDQSYIGVRVTEPCKDTPQVALRLAAAALERGVNPIILATIAGSGFENFGFRVERLASNDAKAQEAQEKELAAFWNFAMILDVSDVVSLG